MAGGVLRLFAGLIESPATRWLLVERLLHDAGVTALRELAIDEPPAFQPHFPYQPLAAGESFPSLPDLASWSFQARQRQKGFPFTTVQDYAQAYRSGAASPEAIAQQVLAAIKASDAAEPPLRAFIACDRDDVLAQARASAQRFQAGKPLGPFDGVPVAVKDEVDQLPYATTVGTCFLGQEPARQDSTVVARMRAAGAMLIGKANMHEIGIGVTGLNPHHGTVRNPYHTGHYTGGSSSGPAAAVAAGLCPVAIGADGGGSIRIPAAFCGVVGLKPTYSRVSEFGAAPLAWSVAHLGPIAATAQDAALAYAVMAGPDPHDPGTLGQPPVSLAEFDRLNLDGLTMGVYWPWFNHATPAVVDVCKQMVQGFERLGAQVRQVEIPELEAARVAHVVTISAQMAAAMEHCYAAHQRDFGLDVRVNLALARLFTARDYIQAQRIRARAIAHFNRVLEQVDVIVTPATACAAPPIPADALPDGESDLGTLTEIMRFATTSNLTGLPAISFPADYDGQGLPVGVQVIGRPWAEHVLLRLAHAAEQMVERRKPQVHFQILE